MPLKQKKRGRKSKAEKREIARKRTQHFTDWATIGREVVINGKTIRVYTRGKIVEAFAYYGIPKTYQTVYLWETKGVLPKSPIVINGRSFYTQRMIEAIVQTSTDFGADNIRWTDAFKKALKEAFDNALRKDLE